MVWPLVRAASTDSVATSLTASTFLTAVLCCTVPLLVGGVIVRISPDFPVNRRGVSSLIFAEETMAFPSLDGVISDGRAVFSQVAISLACKVVPLARNSPKAMPLISSAPAAITLPVKLPLMAELVKTACCCVPLIGIPESSKFCARVGAALAPINTSA